MVEAVVWAVVIAGVAVTLYALHRRYVWLQERGFVDEAKASGGGPFLALREFIQPSTQHVRHVEEDRVRRSKKEAPGEGDAPDRPKPG